MIKFKTKGYDKNKILVAGICRYLTENVADLSKLSGYKKLYGTEDEFKWDGENFGWRIYYTVGITGHIIHIVVDVPGREDVESYLALKFG